MIPPLLPIAFGLLGGSRSFELPAGRSQEVQGRPRAPERRSGNTCGSPRSGAACEHLGAQGMLAGRLVQGRLASIRALREFPAIRKEEGF